MTRPGLAVGAPARTRTLNVDPVAGATAATSGVVLPAIAAPREPSALTRYTTTVPVSVGETDCVLVPSTAEVTGLPLRAG